jgi:hypothetical protein
MPDVLDRLINSRIGVRFRHAWGSRGCLFNAGMQAAQGLRPRLGGSPKIRREMARFVN